MNDERDFLERSLADLELERAAGDLSDDDYADLRSRYERKLAALPTPTTGEKPKGWGRTVVTVVVVAVIAVGAGIGVAAWSGSREPGQQLSGKEITSHQQQMTRAAQLFQEGDASGAVEIYQALIDENPDDAEALTYMGWTLRNVALQQQDERLSEAAVGFIEHATQVEPTYAEAWFFRGIIYLRDENDRESAVDALRLALANDPIPEIEAAARELLSEIAQD